MFRSRLWWCASLAETPPLVPVAAGANVMISIFGDFCKFSAKKVAIFFEANVTFM
jgi:hypothetical protein